MCTQNRTIKKVWCRKHVHTSLEFKLEIKLLEIKLQILKVVIPTIIFEPLISKNGI